MGILDKIKGGGKEKDKKVPVQEVVSFKRQGMNNDQIINQLRAEGYEFQQIKDAMSQAELKTAATNKQSQIPQKQTQTPQRPQLPQVQQGAQMPDFGAPEMETGFTPAPGMEVKDRSVEEIERILEQIIEEKWAEVEEKLGVMENWKAKVEKKIDKLESKIDNFNSRVDSIEATMTAKVDEYGKSMQEVSVEMQAMDKVMSKLVPTLTDSIKELKQVTEKKKSD